MVLEWLSFLIRVLPFLSSSFSSSSQWSTYSNTPEIASPLPLSTVDQYLRLR